MGCRTVVPVTLSWVQSFIIKIRLDAYVWTVYRRYSAFRHLAEEVRGKPVRRGRWIRWKLCGCTPALDLPLCSLRRASVACRRFRRGNMWRLPSTCWRGGVWSSWTGSAQCVARRVA